jgi:hypothetical protein
MLLFLPTKRDNCNLPPPSGIRWGLLPAEMLASIPSFTGHAEVAGQADVHGGNLRVSQSATVIASR